jgi:hypothetical protein
MIPSTSAPTPPQVVKKPSSMTATVLKRARQRKKPSPPLDIAIDDDSISSACTSSTVGYRDSFGENDDGCFHLLERYDDSSAVMRLLHSRRKASRDQESLLGEVGREALLLEEECVTPIVEDSGQEENEEQVVTNYVIFEQNDEDTLI